MRGRLRDLFGRFMDAEVDFHERIFLLLTTIAESAIFIAFLGDVFTGENVAEIAVLAGLLIAAPIFTVFSIRKGKVNLGAALNAVTIIFIVLPATFYFGGGLTGGSNIWFAFAYLYIGLTLVGKLRTVMLVLLNVLIVVEYVTTYFHPSLIIEHNRFMWFADSGISVLLVGFLIYITVRFQNKIFLEENRRAMEQARKIEKLNQAQNHFFSSMSHEIRTPINTIIGLNEMILREDVSDEVAEDARNIQAASKILLSLINDILDMSKIESGKMDIVLMPYDVGKMISEIVNMIWVRANEKGLQFTVDVDPAMPSQLFSDEVRIKQILINLLNNAIKYTQEGGVSLSIHSRRTEQGKAYVTYTVKDTGMGIRKESIPHLFDAFRREDEEKNRYIEGTGLGLSIVKQLVDLLGGEIFVDSVYTKGSTFTVTIQQEIVDGKTIGKYDPRKFHASDVRERYHQSFEAPKARILIVDDNTANLLVATKLLRETKVQIDTARSGEECLNFTSQVKYQVIFMDHMMPGMDGIECLHAIREQSGGLCRDTPVVVLTANAGSENQMLYHREGFDGYLLKPVEGAVLEGTLLKLLPGDLVSISKEERDELEADQLVRETRHKIPLLITTDSVSDLPGNLLTRMKIPVLPYKVHTEEGIFFDGLEAESDAILRYLEDRDSRARSEAPDVAEYESFFAGLLSGTQHVLHIAMAEHSSNGYANASEAALSFYNVKVIESGHLSSGMGLMVLAAKELADAGQFDMDILRRELEQKREKIRTSFIVDSTEYLYRGGRLPERIHKFCKAFMLHPVIKMKKSSMQVGGIIIGSSKKARSAYIRKVLRRSSEIDTSVLFITYAGMRRQEVEEIRQEVLTILKFEKIYLQKASPAISINCGPGSFGLIFARK